MRRLAWLVLLAACGVDGAGPDAAPPLDGWRTGAPVVGGPIQETAAVAIGDSVYVIGGFGADLAIHADVLAYDTVADTWSRAPSLPVAVHHANAAVVDGTIYILGALQAFEFTAHGEVWSWTPGDAAWTSRTPMPSGTERGASVVGAIEGAIVVAGGLRDGAAVTDVSRYLIAGDTWEPLDPLPAARDHACGGVLAGVLVVAGGRQADIASTSPQVHALESTGWTARADMITGRGGTACGVVADRLIVVGGEGNPDASTGVFPQVESYDPVADAWTSLGTMPTPRHGMAAAVVGATLHVPGGATVQSFGAVDTNESFTP